MSVEGDVNTESPSRDAHIRISVFTRDRLREIRDGVTYSETIAGLVGRWDHVNTDSVRKAPDTPDTGRHAETTTVRVSEQCRDHLKRVRDEMGVESLGDVVAVLVSAF